MSYGMRLMECAAAVSTAFTGAAQFTAGSGSTIELTSRLPNIFGTDGDYLEFEIVQSSASAWTVFGSTVSPDAVIVNDDTITITDGTTSDSITLLASIPTDEWTHVKLIRNGSTIECYINMVLEVQTLDVIPIDIDIIGKNTPAYTDVRAVKLAGFDGDYLHNATPSAALQGADTGFWRSGWFYLDSVGDHTIADCLTGNNGWRIEVENVYLSQHRLKFTVGNGTETVTLESTETFSEQQLIHFYVDLEDLGETTPDEGDTTIEGTFTPEDGDFYVGATRGTSNFFDGKIDSLFGGDGNLSSGQVTWLYNSGLGRVVDEIGAGTTVSTSDIDFGWGLEETSGTRLDAFGSDDLTEVPGTWTSDGFENVTGGVFDEWTTQITGTATSAPDTLTVRTGTYSAKLYIDDGSSFASVLSPVAASLTPGKEYTISVWAAASATGVTLRIDPNDNASPADKLTSSTSYTEYTHTFTEFSDSNIRLNLRSSAGETLYLDDVSIASSAIISDGLVGTSYTSAAAFTGYLRKVKLNANAGYVNLQLYEDASDIGGDSNNGTATAVTFVAGDPA